MNTKNMRAVAALALGAVAMSSQAAVVTLTGWAFGSGHGVNVGVPNHSGLAGGFKGSVDFNAGEEAAGFTDILGGSFITYCVEINEHFGFSGSGMNNYLVQAASNYSSLFGPLGSTKSNRLGQLMSHVASNSTIVDSSAESTSLQLAIWNIIYDTDQVVSAGAFMENTVNGAFKSYANTLLNDSMSATNRYEVYVLSKAGSQDFLLLRELPEPASLALALGALGGLGFASRRRKAA